MSSLSFADQLDQSIGILMAQPNAAHGHADAGLSELLGIAAELRLFPRPQFKQRLKADLLRQALLVSEAAPARVNTRVLEVAPRPKPAQPQPDILPTLFGVGYGSYPVRRSNFVTSLAAHAAVIALMLGSSLWLTGRHPKVGHQFVTELTIPSLYSPPAYQQNHGGGGGGDRDKLSASKGELPLLAREQMTPPTVIVRDSKPELAIAPTVVAPPMTMPQAPQMGDPLAAISGPPSNGAGSASGIGDGTGGGIGSGEGAGIGPGSSGGYGGGVYRIGGGVTAPRAIYDPDPEYSDEARKAKYEGTVVLWAVIGADGRPKDIRVSRALGLGLDQKAMEAVRNWRFQPAMKDGRPVAVQLNIEVNFRLY